VNTFWRNFLSISEVGPILALIAPSPLRVEVAAVSRNRYGVEKTIDTHKILINAIQCCLSSRNMIDKSMCEVL
jgi:hypothetical protein